MSKQVALAADRRAGDGKGEARALRREGRVPAVAYGAGLDATPLSVDGLELFHALNTDAGTNAIIQLRFDGQTHLSLAREIQRHPVRRDVLHVDFVGVERDVKVTVDVPLSMEGEEEAPGAVEGGVLDQQLYTLSVEVLPLEVPDQIVVDVSEMELGDVLRVADLPLPSGVEALDDPERTVVTLTAPTVEEEPEEEEVPEEELAEGEEPAEGAEEGEAAAEATEAEETGEESA